MKTQTPPKKNPSQKASEKRANARSKYDDQFLKAINKNFEKETKYEEKRASQYPKMNAKVDAAWGRYDRKMNKINEREYAKGGKVAMPMKGMKKPKSSSCK